MNFVDLHCDTLLEMYLRKKDLAALTGHVNLQKLRRGGALLQCFAAFLPSHDCAARYGIAKAPAALFQELAALYDAMLAQNAAELAPVRRYADIARNRDAGKISALLTVEDLALLDGALDRLDALYARGVRMASLTWNYENSLGCPNAPRTQLHARPLKPFGIEAVRRMNELGMLVDVSHLSEGGFWDVAAHSTRPFVASHSCARALCAHSRNLTDAQLKALGDCGGVCGVNFYAAFLRDGGERTENADIVRHMLHIKNQAGMEAVALGSDFDGIDCALAMEDYAGLPTLLDAMHPAFTDDEIERICAGNALRLLHDVLA